MEAAAVIGLVKADSCTGSSGVPRDNPPQTPPKLQPPGNQQLPPLTMLTISSNNYINIEVHLSFCYFMLT